MYKIKAILDEFPIDVESLRKLNIRLGEGSTIYKVENSWLMPPSENLGEVYLIDSTAGATIACHPHIVGEELRMLSLKVAKIFVKALASFELLEANKMALMHILRAGTAYMVGDALPFTPSLINIRTRYIQNGYRDHSNALSDLEVSYMEHSGEIENATTILIPDTFATGRSSEAALSHIMDYGYNPSKVILYGFISIPALIRMSKICHENDIELISFAICDLTQLSQNHYDMCVYGPDESRYHESGEYKTLGSIIGAETLRRILPEYIPGLDQPGDWSERQDELFNGYEEEKGDIRGHLQKTIRIIENLRCINQEKAWYQDYHVNATINELNKLYAKLKELK